MYPRARVAARAHAATCSQARAAPTFRARTRPGRGEVFPFKSHATICIFGSLPLHQYFWRKLMLKILGLLPQTLRSVLPTNMACVIVNQRGGFQRLASKEVRDASERVKRRCSAMRGRRPRQTA